MDTQEYRTLLAELQEQMRSKEDSRIDPAKMEKSILRIQKVSPHSQPMH